MTFFVVNNIIVWERKRRKLPTKYNIIVLMYLISDLVDLWYFKLNSAGEK